MSMKYDDALGISRFPSVMNERFYSSYFKPYLNNESDKDFHNYFLEQAGLAWRNDIGEDAIKKMLFVESLCQELYEEFPNDFVDLASYIMAEDDTVRTILHESERNHYEANEDGLDSKVKNALDHYKVLFESGLRLRSTIPYFYSCKILGFKHSAITAQEFVNVSSSEKYNFLKDRTFPLIKGNISSLVEGFDNRFRNAGGGHDFYEIQDDGKVNLRVVDPKSGVIKENIELTYEDILAKLNNCRRTLWILTNGFAVFLNNNHKFRKLLKSVKPLKIGQIKRAIEEKANSRGFTLENFNYDSRKKMMKVVFKVKRTIGQPQDILFGNGEKYDILSIITELTYESQILNLIHYLHYLIKSDFEVVAFEVEVLDKDGKTFGSALFNGKKLDEAFQNKSKPKPESGSLPSGKYEFTLEKAITYGTKDGLVKVLKQKGFKVY